VEADSESRAVSAVSASGLIPVKISKVLDKRAGFKSILNSRIKLETLAIFARKLLALTKAGIPILRSLDIIISDVSDAKLAETLEDIRKSIEGGSSLAEAFEKHIGYFPELFVSTIRAGEESGSLDIMLARASELLEREMRLKENVRSAVRYPGYVLLTIAMAFFVVITFVIPKFAGFYTSYGAELPWATRLLVGINRFILNNWGYLAGALALTALGFWLSRNSDRGRKTYDFLSISIPILGGLKIKIILSRFCYILSTLLSAGLPLTQSLSVLRNSISNYYFSKVLSEMGENLSGGSDVVSAMRSSKYFSSMVVQMFSIGLETGSLESLLMESAKYYDIEIEQEARKLTGRIEPLLTVAVGATVLILALAIFLPMWNMISIFKK
jgi:MSHA biogenesis protein MshG